MIPNWRHSDSYSGTDSGLNAISRFSELLVDYIVGYLETFYRAQIFLTYPGKYYFLCSSVTKK